MTKAKQEEPEPGLGGTFYDTYEKVSDRVASAYEAARDRAAVVVQTTGSGLEANPLVAIAGGLAVGIAAAALIPRGEREQAMLAPLGSRVASAAKAALEAAKVAGADALEDAGLSPDKLRGQVSAMVEQALGAASAAGSAAVEAARDAAAHTS